MYNELLLILVTGTFSSKKQTSFTLIKSFVLFYNCEVCEN